MSDTQSVWVVTYYPIEGDAITMGVHWTVEGALSRGRTMTHGKDAFGEGWRFDAYSRVWERADGAMITVTTYEVSP